jgi:hypothetical protein
VGYTGRILVARSEQPLAEWKLLGDTDVLDESVYPGGWRSAQLDGDMPAGLEALEALEALVVETGAPALSAFVLFSDLADVQALTPGGVTWHTYLHEELAREYGGPELPQSADEVLAGALAWSAEAGLTADPETVWAALAAKNVTAEDSLWALVTALGVGTAT